MTIHLVCGTVAEALKSLSTDNEMYKNKIPFSKALKMYRELQLLTSNHINNCFGMMSFNLILANMLEASLSMYALMRLIEYMTLESTTLFWANVVYYNLKYPIGWTCMANIKERSKHFKRFWKRKIRRSTLFQAKHELKINIREWRSISEIQYFVGSNFFSTSNLTLLNILYMTSSNIIFFLQL